MAIKRNPADAAFSKCVREAADYKCEKCGTRYPRGSTGLHCSHIYSRRHRTIRWCKINAQALCYSCHQWYGGNPAESGIWIRNLMGKMHDLLVEKMNLKCKVSRLEEKEIAAHYKNETKMIEQKRMLGQINKIDYTSWQ